MKIIVIGSKGLGKGAHFAENISKAFNILNHDVFHYDPEDLKRELNPQEWNRHAIQRKPVRLSLIIKNEVFDLIFIDQCNFQFKNDVSIPVFYYHKYLHRHPSVFYPDVIFYPDPAFLHFFVNQEHQWYNYHVKIKQILYPSIDLDLYEPREKIIKGTIGIGFRRSFESWVKAGGLAEGATSDVIENDVKQFMKTGLCYYYTPVSDEEYRDLLSQSESVWVPVPPYQYITRRMLEAMACKTTCILKLQDKRHEEILKGMGFLSGIHYICPVNIESINTLYKSTFSDKDRRKIINNAFKEIQNHSSLKRAEQILTAYFDYIKKESKKIELKTLDLGCGLNKTPNSIGVDIVKLEGVDIVHDLNKIPYPFQSNSMEQVILNDVLEHLNDPINVLKESHRILKEGGMIKIRVVHWNHRYSYSDPQHKHAFSELVWDFFTGKRRSYYTDFKFKNLKIDYIFDPKAENFYGSDEIKLLRKAYFHSNIIQGMNITMEK
ncbi:MAG: class I SAM-dependent methyltransferase [Candidatus Peregrinibacteria bacterium]|nr:class I SAM-dependent methyltransferase [Candidatus Peregrinibacteria bacterium]